MSVEQRTLQVVAFSGWPTICHLICEDLARVDPVSHLIRGIGPTLLIALLLDGPQVAARWPGRYTTVFADDPGCSVLTLTSLGFALLNNPPNHGRQRAIALWKDPRTGTQTIELKENQLGAVLSLWEERYEEFTADGRSDNGMAGRLVLGDVQGVTPAPGLRRPTGAS